MADVVFNLSRKSELTTNIFSLSSSDMNHEEIIAEIILQIQKTTEIEAIGLRISDDLDYPYYFTNGFGNDFIQKEMHLCAVDMANEIIRDSTGNPVLECMCGNIICERTNPLKPFFTKGGSFWSNCTTDLLASTTEKDREARTRNRCNSEGYETVALIPIKSERKIFGLLQLNDHRKGMFSIEDIIFFEGIASIIGILFTSIKAKEKLVAKTDDVIRAASVRIVVLEKIADRLRESENLDRDLPILTKLDSILDEINTIKETVPICACCKSIRTDVNYWQQIEEFIMDRTKAKFTHTFCPECYKKWKKKGLL